MPKIAERPRIQPVRTESPQRAEGGSRAGQTVTVQKGDTLWKLAQQAYGDGNLWPLIRDANPGQVKMKGKDIAIIQIGAKLVVPERPQSPAAPAENRGWEPRPSEQRPAGGTEKPGGPGRRDAASGTDAPSPQVQQLFNEMGQRTDKLRSEINARPPQQQAEIMKWARGEGDVSPELRSITDQVGENRAWFEQSLRSLSPEDQLAVAKSSGPEWASQLSERLHDMIRERDEKLNEADNPGANALEELIASLMRAAGGDAAKIEAAYEKEFGASLDEQIESGLPPQRQTGGNVDSAPSPQAPAEPEAQAPQQPQAPEAPQQPQQPQVAQQPQQPQVAQQPQQPQVPQQQPQVAQQPQQPQPSEVAPQPQQPSRPPAGRPPTAGAREQAAMAEALRDGKVTDQELKTIVAAAKADIAESTDVAGAYQLVADRLTDFANRFHVDNGQAAVNEVADFAIKTRDERKAQGAQPAQPAPPTASTRQLSQLSTDILEGLARKGATQEQLTPLAQQLIDIERNTADDPALRQMLIQQLNVLKAEILKP